MTGCRISALAMRVSAVSRCGLVAVAAPVDQVGRAGCPQAGVIEQLEDRRGARGEVRGVHVVDRVRQLPGDPEALRRAEARAVLDVAALLAPVPVHSRDQMPVLGCPRGDRGRTDRCDRGKRGHAVGYVATALDQLAQYRSGAFGDGPLEHGRRHRVDHTQDELGRAHRRRVNVPGFAGQRTCGHRAGASAGPATRTARASHSRARAPGRRARSPRAPCRRGSSVTASRAGRSVRRARAPAATGRTASAASSAQTAPPTSPGQEASPWSASVPANRRAPIASPRPTRTGPAGPSSRRTDPDP